MHSLAWESATLVPLTMNVILHSAQYESVLKELIGLRAARVTLALCVQLEVIARQLRHQGQQPVQVDILLLQELVTAHQQLAHGGIILDLLIQRG